MKILGIHDGHNATAALVVNGKVVAAVQEERLRQIKNWSGFPTQAVESVLHLGGLRPEDVDILTYNGNHIAPAFSREEDLHAPRKNSGWYGWLLHLTRSTPIMSIYRRNRYLRRLDAARKMGVPEEKVHFTEHHMAHAAAAYYGWGNYEEPILILTADGAGDELSATVSMGVQGEVKRLASISRNNSIGTVY
ncbi:MAG TPA: carbamoyltransferase N-terminal domain-containing protein, partial [Aggregatilineales bacterium]|nr:carbamoyltransferase N-terminal domain-containing protein [Aggregatilineales bacterium]